MESSIWIFFWLIGILYSILVSAMAFVAVSRLGDIHEELRNANKWNKLMYDAMPSEKAE